MWILQMLVHTVVSNGIMGKVPVLASCNAEHFSHVSRHVTRIVCAVRWGKSGSVGHRDQLSAAQHGAFECYVSLRSLKLLALLP